MLKSLRRARIGRDTLILIFVFVVSTISILLNIPSTTPYIPYNIYGNGYHSFFKMLKAALSIDIPKADAGDVVVLPLARYPNNYTYRLLEDLLKNGVTVVVIDEYGYSNELLKRMGIDAEVSRIKVLDEVSKLYSREYPLIELRIENVSIRLATYRPSYIVLNSFTNLVGLGSTSRYAYADENGDGYFNLGERMGVYNVVCSWTVENGKLWLIADLDVFKNELMEVEGNRDFLRFLGGRNIYIVIGYLDMDVLDRLKYLLDSVTRAVWIREDMYKAMVVYIASIFIAVSVGYRRRG